MAKKSSGYLIPAPSSDPQQKPSINDIAHGLGCQIQLLSRKIVEIEETKEEFHERLEWLEENFDVSMTVIHDRISQMNPDKSLTYSKLTKKRIGMLEDYLKAQKNGATTFTTARKALGLSQSQFSKIVAKLDKRRFSIGAHPRNQKMKIIKLRRFTGGGKMHT